MKIKLVILFLGFYLLSNAQVANFSMSPSKGCSPLNVNFTDLSTGPVTSWDWDFGNSNNSILQHPGSVYIGIGDYPVRLIVSDGITSDTIWDTVVVHDIPQIDFIGIDSVGCGPLNTTFTNLSTTGSGIQSVQWNFGDATSSGAFSPPPHNFPIGTYDITLTVTDSSGCINQDSKIGYIISSSPPVPNFTAINTQNCALPTNVVFTNTSFNASGATYWWDFGDGSPSSSLVNPSHAYTSFGTFDVTLVVSNGGCSDTIVKTNFVSIQGQNTDFSFSNATICEGQSVSFTDLSTLTATSFSWDFGDGSPISTAQNPSHTYNTPGTYTVTFNTFLTGCDDSETKLNLVTVNANPTVSINSDVNDTCGGPFLVNFTSIASPGVTYSWNFGDGSPASILPNPSHTYTSNGSFNVSLTVTNANNCSASTSNPNFINITPPNANFVLDSAIGCAPITTIATSTSTSTSPIISWQWDFGDGSPPLIGMDSTPSHLYDSIGNYFVSLIIINADGCTDTLAPGLPVILGQEIIPSFTAVPDSGCRMDDITFTNTTDTIGISANTTWLWNLGDGGTSLDFSPIYQYGDTGIFTVSLTATNNGCVSDTIVDSLIRIFPPIALFDMLFDCDNLFDVEFQDNSVGVETWEWDIDGMTFSNDTILYTFPDTGVYPITLTVENNTFGCTDTIEQSVTIVNPSIDFTLNDSLGCRPFNVQFTDLSVDAVGWEWDFGDGTANSFNQNPSHSYNSVGTYSVKLTITSINGCTDTLEYQNVITVISNTTNFTVNDSVGCNPHPVTFTDQSSGIGGPITNWVWDFGDGSPGSNLQNPSHVYNAVGSFTVNLSITDSSGCTSSLNKLQYIVSSGITPNFTNPAVSCHDLPINFTSTSSSLGGTITNWFWDFGDGDTSILEHPTHTYTHPGTYDVSLYVIDDNLCDSTIITTSAIIIDSLTVDFSADSTVGNCTGFIVNFQELSSSNANSWLWNFNDGSPTTTIPNPSHVFGAVGLFNVSLVSTTSSGCRDTITKSNFITINGPSGDLTTSVDSGCINLEVEFTLSNTTSFIQTWDFGEGTVITNSLDTMSFTYTNVDTFQPIIVLEDSAGCVVPYFFDSIVTADISGDFISDLDYICTPNSINFNDISFSEPAPISWLWDFGDGDTSSAQNPSHTYNSHGVFDINMIVNNGFCSDTILYNQMIVSDSSTLADFGVVSPPLICPPVSITFTDSSSADSTIASWSWDFGNTTTSMLQNPPAITYNMDGRYLVTLDIVTANGCISHYEDSISVYPIPTIDIDLDSMELCINEDTALNLTVDGSLQWDPPTNLSCSDCPDPVITALNSNTYTVTATTAFGCTFQDTLHFIVHGTPPITLSEDQKVIAGTEVQMHAFSSATTNFVWTPNEDLECNNCENNSFVALENTTFVVEVLNEFGCTNADSITIEVFDICAEGYVMIPNIFTPNGDRLNDEFKIYTRNNLGLEINYFRIFDRWGDLLFETTDAEEYWDGTKNGTIVSNGVYVYTMEINCPDNEVQIFNGNVTLMR